MFLEIICTKLLTEQMRKLRLGNVKWLAQSHTAPNEKVM